MATAFINRITGWCSGSRTLAWLLTSNVAAALSLWLASFALMLCGAGSGVLYELTALPSNPVQFATHPWTLLSYMFIHFSPLHLIFNVLWLYWFGRMLADTGRDSELIRLYLASGVTGGVLYVLTSWLTGYAPGAYLTGASAAVLGIMCATALRMPDREIGLFLIGFVRLKWVALACIVLTLLGSWGAGAPTQAAHIGGVAAGAVWFFCKCRPGSRRDSRTRRVKARATLKAMKRTVSDHERLDQLLDKIRISGYDSLSAKEKTELNYISARIKD